MSLATARRIARRELRAGLHGFRVFLACLILGVAAIAAIGSVRESIRAGLEREGATILGGDAELELTYRFAEPEELAWMKSNSTAMSELVDFRSMAVFGEGPDAERGLTQVKAVDAAYPLLGAVQLDPDMELSDALAGLDGTPGAVIAPLLVDRLGMNVGDRFKLGTQEFVLMARLEHEPDDAGGSFGLGPRTIVLTTALDQSGLIQPGTLYDTEYKLLLFRRGQPRCPRSRSRRSVHRRPLARPTQRRTGRGAFRGALIIFPCSRGSGRTGCRRSWNLGGGTRLSGAQDRGHRHAEDAGRRTAEPYSRPTSCKSVRSLWLASSQVLSLARHFHWSLHLCSKPACRFPRFFPCTCDRWQRRRYMEFWLH